MNILMIGPDQENSTDGVIIQGTKNLLEAAYGNYSHKYVFIDDHNLMQESDFYPYYKFDLVIVCGTPWLWDNFQLSAKYKNLVLAFNTHPETKKLFMGVGTCLNLKDANSAILERPEEVRAFNETYKDATVIVRDHLAHQKLNKIGIKNHFLPCPAYFCYGTDFKPQKAKGYNALIWTDPEKTISSGDWKNKAKLQNYYDVVLEFYKRYKPAVFCAKEDDVPKAFEIGLPTPRLLTSYTDTLTLLKYSSVVLSGRVHCAVPAFIQNKTVGILPIDTRHYVLSDFGGIVVNNIDDLNKLKIVNNDILKYNNEYINILKGLK